jgi:hypothetical protein
MIFKNNADSCQASTARVKDDEILTGTDKIDKSQ